MRPCTKARPMESDREVEREVERERERERELRIRIGWRTGDGGDMIRRRWGGCVLLAVFKICRDR